MIESHRIYDHEFFQLLSVMREQDYQPAMDAEFKIIKDYSGDGPWIQEIPNDFPELLAELEEKDLRLITKAGRDLMDRVSPPIKQKELLNYLRGLQNLCKKSVETGQSVYLWTST